MRTDLRPWFIFFLFVSVIAATFGFFLVIGIVAAIAKVLFVVFAVLFLTYLVRRYSHHH